MYTLFTSHHLLKEYTIVYTGGSIDTKIKVNNKSNIIRVEMIIFLDKGQASIDTTETEIIITKREMIKIKKVKRGITTL